MRQSWDQYYIDIAEKVASRGTCNRLQVGAVVVKNKRIISTGYNGSIHGHDHCTEAGCLLNDQGRCIRTIHAEQNAILHANRDEIEGSTVYCTHEPCETCTKLLAQVGVREIIFKHGYDNKYNQYFNQGIKWTQHQG